MNGGFDTKVLLTGLPMMPTEANISLILNEFSDRLHKQRVG